MDRRSFLTGIGGLLIVAPAVVRAGSLMPVRALSLSEWGEQMTAKEIGVFFGESLKYPDDPLFSFLKRLPPWQTKLHVWLVADGMQMNLPLIGRLRTP